MQLSGIEPQVRSPEGRARGFAQWLKWLLITPTDQIFPQTIRYMAVGALATVVDVGLLKFLTDNCHIFYLVSAALSFTISVIVAYVASIRFVFASRTLNSSGVEFGIFAIIGVAGLAWTEAIMYTGVTALKLHYLVAKLSAVVLVFAWNYGVRRAILFRRRKSNGR